MSLTTTLNITCTCPQCLTFLHPATSSLPPLAPQRKTSTPSWMDKLWLSAYNMQPMMPTEPSKRLRLVTAPSAESSSSPASSNNPSIVRSAFPKTPGTLRCAHAYCRARVPVSWSLVAAGGVPLCEDHGDVFFDAQEQVNSPPLGRARTASQSHEEMVGEEMSCCSDGSSVRMSRKGLGSRTSSVTSWGTLESWDGHGDRVEWVEEKREEAEWDAGAFESRLCW